MTRLITIGTHHGLVEPSRLPAAGPARTALEARLTALRDDGRIAGGVVLASCHRTEVLLETCAPEPTREEVFGGLLDDTLPVELHRGEAAVHHLLRIAVGLDSVVVGEEQILGQVGEAFRSADEHGLVGRSLHKLRNRLLAAARDTRAKLGLTGRNISSMAAVGARHLAERGGKRLAVVGAGETGRLALAQLARRDDLEALYIVNRSLDKAQSLARHFGAQPLSLREFLADAPALDGVLFAVGGQDRLCTAALATGWRMVVDLSLPSVVDASARALPDLEVVDLDGIERIAAAHAEELADAVRSGDALCRSLARQLHGEVRREAHGPDFGAIVNMHVESARAELDNALRGALRHLTDEDRERLERVLEKTAKKTAHLHIQDVRRLAAEREQQERAREAEEPCGDDGAVHAPSRTALAVTSRAS